MSRVVRFDSSNTSRKKLGVAGLMPSQLQTLEYNGIVINAVPNERISDYAFWSALNLTALAAEICINGDRAVVPGTPRWTDSWQLAVYDAHYRRHGSSDRGRRTAALYSRHIATAPISLVVALDPAVYPQGHPGMLRKEPAHVYGHDYVPDAAPLLANIDPHTRQALLTVMTRVELGAAAALGLVV